MAKAYLIHGFVGTGKTTFAKKLESECGAIRFSPDEWMTRLHGNSPPHEKFQHYEAHILDFIWELAIRLLRQGVDVILDFGFWKRAARDEARRRVEEAGAEVILYCLTCSDDLIRSRVLKRSEDCGDGVLVIDEAAIKLFRTRFEPLEEDERHLVVQPGSDRQ